MNKCLCCGAPKNKGNRCNYCRVEYPTDKKEKFRHFLYEQNLRSDKYMTEFAYGTPLGKVMIFKLDDLKKLKNIVLGDDKNEKS